MGDRADLVRTLFDTKAAGWPGKYTADGRLAGRLAQLAGAVLGLTAEGSELLDLGCGSGELARYLAAAGYRVSGCDIAPRMLRQAAVADTGRRAAWTRWSRRACSSTCRTRRRCLASAPGY
jgi:2-polyprenyl-3-methyl-5-hydroxy-6-metoxy-1,4-benzoquinol methylase